MKFLNLFSFLKKKIPTKSQLKDILHQFSAHQVLDINSLHMMEGVLKVSDLRARDIMVPRSQMAFIETHFTLNDTISIILKTVHSRFPVIGDNKDEILGILLAKDLLTYSYNQSPVEFKIKDVIRPAMFVPESKRLDVLLNEFRMNHNHMAIVVNEYGGVTGLITIEDVLEEIVGNIEDEHDIDNEHHIKPLQKENTFSVNALTPLQDFNRYFKSKLQDKEVETIGGLVVRMFGHLPKKGEEVHIGDFLFKVLRADKRRILLLQISSPKPFI